MSSRFKQIITESGYKGLVNRVMLKIIRELNQGLRFLHALCFGTYKNKVGYSTLKQILSRSDLKALAFVQPLPKEVIKNYLEHRFDLLGSGWVQVQYGMHCSGLEKYHFHNPITPQFDTKGEWLKGRINSSNLAKAQRIWQHISPDYIPIDWQLDFKSGYRWHEGTWAKKIKFGHILGADVKVPWELSRMQHWPQLARCCFSDTLSEAEKQQIQLKYQNQLLDFIATNPPGFGVNWACPMDIAIRAANWLLAYDLFLAANLAFPEYFEKILTQSIYEHGIYIANNLEWGPHRANHYLANLAGLAFVAAYMPSGSNTDAWLAFVIQELNSEVERQFHDDGGNFEGSTAYHRLSTEMVYYATALILGLPENTYKNRYHFKISQQGRLKFGVIKKTNERLPLFTEEYFLRLEKMMRFVIDITKPNGMIIQIGDNDSGRFFKLAPQYWVIAVEQAKALFFNLEHYVVEKQVQNYYVENSLNCSHIIAAGQGLFETNEEVLAEVDTIVIQSFLKRPRLGSNLEYAQLVETALNGTIPNISDDEPVLKFTIQEGSLVEQLKCVVYPNFGLYVFKSPRLYLAIRCWVDGIPEHSAHRHADQFSIELNIDGQDLINDPGTYLYTPIPTERYLYRNGKSHFPPIKANEELPIDINVFSSLFVNNAQVYYFGEKGFVAETKTSGLPLRLHILLEKKSVLIYHDSSFITEESEMLPLSLGYGLKFRQGYTIYDLFNASNQVM